jgi:hypothetical protein
VTTAQITRENISQRPLAMSVLGITHQLLAGQVLHCMHDGAAFVITSAASDGDPWELADQLATTMPTFVIEIGPADLKSLSARRASDRRLTVSDSEGIAVADIRVHNKRANPRTAAGRVPMDIVLASALKSGDTFCDGTTASAGNGWAVFTADDTTAGQYLPGRVVFKI